MRIIPELSLLTSLRTNLTDPHGGVLVERCGLFIAVLDLQNPLPFRDGSHVLVLEAVFDTFFDAHREEQ